ncbi:MAG: hypothetical protein M1822_004687 [Bathelium mastoideum]|nr:MAG: hypothetical protein M1822_004687 [Bathelium mastoideum]
MELSRQDYPAMLENLQPAQAVDVLNDRVKHVGRLNTEIADWLKERRRVEEAYAQGLKRLSRLTPPSESSDLGIFSGPWQRIVGATETLSDSHQTLAQRIEVDVERPLRDFQSSNRELQQLSTIQGNLASMAREIESTQKKSDKLNSQGQKASAQKVANAAQEVDNARSQWDSQAPFVFEKLQQVDESRLNQLRDVLTQFQTHEVDHVERIRQSTENCLNGILSIETADEIKTWALRATRGQPRIERTRSRPSLAGSSAPSTANAPPVPPIPHDSLAPTPSAGNDDGSSRSGSLQEQKTPSRLKGLKRIGTVLSRNKRNSMMPLDRDSQSPERKGKSRSPFSSLGARSRTKEQISSSLAPPQEEPSSESRQSASREGETARAQAETSESTSRGINGTTDEGLGQSAFTDEPGSSSGNRLQEPLQPDNIAQQSEPQKDAEGFTVPSSSSDAITQAQLEAAATGDAPSSQFKVDIRNAPIQEEGGDAALANVANTLRASTFPARKSGTVRGRRDRNTIYVTDPQSLTIPGLSSEPAAQISTSLPSTPRLVPPTESTGGEAAKPATPTQEFEPPPGPPPSFGTPADTAQAFEPPPGPPPSHAAKDSTASAESAPSVAARVMTTPVLANAPLSPPKLGPLAGVLGEDHGASDTQSIRSQRSALSSHSATIKHPELHSPGLNSSVVETVNVWFEQGAVTKAIVIGELALAYNPIDVYAPAQFGSDTIRLENFAILEKVAPNPTFIDQIPDKAGEYSVNLSSITKTAVAFKYQVRLDDAVLGAHAPLLLTPAWKCEATQTSVILSYSLNPAFVSHHNLAPSSGSTSEAEATPAAPQTVQLSNVVMIVHIDPAAKASTCQSKPVGTFSRDRSLIYWRLGDVSLSTAPDAPAQKLLARFMTETEAKPGHVEARWEIGGSGAAAAAGSSGSGLSVTRFEEGVKEEGDPFADEEGAGPSTPRGTWKEVEGVRKLVSGTYQAA